MPITVEAVVMSWNIADCVPSYAQGVVVVATKIFNTAAGVLVADVSIWTVIVISTATKMVMTVIATNREELRAVSVVNAT